MSCLFGHWDIFLSSKLINFVNVCYLILWRMQNGLSCSAPCAWVSFLSPKKHISSNQRRKWEIKKSFQTNLKRYWASVYPSFCWCLWKVWTKLAQGLRENENIVVLASRAAQACLHHKLERNKNCNSANRESVVFVGLNIFIIFLNDSSKFSYNPFSKKDKIQDWNSKEQTNIASNRAKNTGKFTDKILLS